MVLILVIETEGVGDLLAYHMSPPLGRVVGGLVEVVVVHLGGRLRDVLSADPDRGDAEPAPPP